MHRHVAAPCSDRREKRIHVGFTQAAPPSVRQARASDAVGMHPPISRRVALQHGPMAVAPIHQGVPVLPPSFPCHGRHLQAKVPLWELHVAQHIQDVYAQPTGERVQVLRQGIAAAQLAHDRVGSLAAMRLADPGAQPVIVQGVHATPGLDLSFEVQLLGPL